MTKKDYKGWELELFDNSKNFRIYQPSYPLCISYNTYPLVVVQLKEDIRILVLMFGYMVVFQIEPLSTQDS